MLDAVFPLGKEIYDRAVELGVTKIILEFQGGSDEGYCNVDAQRPETEIEKTWKALDWSVRNEREKANDSGYQEFKAVVQEIWKFEQQIEDWVWDHYCYSGAGDGTPYGDVVYYDLENKKITTQEWYTPDPKYSEEYDMTDQMPFVSEPSNDVAKYVGETDAE